LRSYLGRNPSTDEAVKIAAQNAPAFKAGKAFKDRVKQQQAITLSPINEIVINHRLVYII